MNIKKLITVLTAGVVMVALGLGLWWLNADERPDRNGRDEKDPRNTIEEDSTSSLEPPVLYIGLMTHVEGWENEAEKEESFNAHKTAVREMAALFEEFDARVTFEAKPSFVEACEVWGDNVLRELYQAGHGIGVHADVGGQLGSTATERMTVLIDEMRINMEELIGAPVRHVSGICSDADWVTAAIEAGYKFTTGGVGFCAISMPQELRPEEYKNCETANECHGLIPLKLEDRMTPWQASSGENWLRHDPNGELVILSSDNGVRYLSEGEYSGNKEMSYEDVEGFVALIDEALSYVEPGRVNSLYLSFSIGDTDWGEETFRQILEAAQPYIDSGKVEWKTLPEVYDLYIEDL